MLSFIHSIGHVYFGRDRIKDEPPEGMSRSDNVPLWASANILEKANPIPVPLLEGASGT